MTTELTRRGYGEQVQGALASPNPLGALVEVVNNYNRDLALRKLENLNLDPSKYATLTTREMELEYDKVRAIRASYTREENVYIVDATARLSELGYAKQVEGALRSPNPLRALQQLDEQVNRRELEAKLISIGRDPSVYSHYSNEELGREIDRIVIESNNYTGKDVERIQELAQKLYEGGYQEEAREASRSPNPLAAFEIALATIEREELRTKLEELGRLPANYRELSSEELQALLPGEETTTPRETGKGARSTTTRSGMEDPSEREQAHSQGTSTETTSPDMGRAEPQQRRDESTQEKVDGRVLLERWDLQDVIHNYYGDDRDYTQLSDRELAKIIYMYYWTGMGMGLIPHWVDFITEGLITSFGLRHLDTKTLLERLWEVNYYRINPRLVQQVQAQGDEALRALLVHSMLPSLP